MKKHLDIPQVSGVYIAALRERHKEYFTWDWNVYLINDLDYELDTVLIVSYGFDSVRQTAVMRHSLDSLPPKSFAKIEFLQDDVLSLNNEFSVSYFAEGKMLHKKFLFPKNSINENALRELPVIMEKGVLLK